MRAICIDIENTDDEFACKKGNHYNQCCQECGDRTCTGCDYRYDNDCIGKKWIEE